MQKLGIVGRLFPEVLSGRKLSTIRWRERRIVPGHMRYICEDDPQQIVIVWVTKCTDMPLSAVATFLDMESEWPEAVLLAGMCEHYPTIAWEDEVQVIEHLSPADTAAVTGRT